MTFKILLVYFRSEQFYSIMNPLSIEALIGHLQGVFKGNIEIEYQDIHSESEMLKLRSILDSHEYNLIGFSLMSYTSEIFINSIKDIDFKRALIVLGNQLATYSAEFLLKKAIETGNIKSDRILSIKGEGELVLEKIIYQMLQSTDGYALHNINKIPNIVYYDHLLNIKETLHQEPELCNLTFPPHYLYTDIPFIQMQLSRGCYWGNCSFCTRKSFRMGKRWESFPLERIERDLSFVICKTQANVIEFCDDEFFGGNSDHHIDRCNKIIDFIENACSSSGKKIIFRLFTRPDFIYTPDNEDKNQKIRHLLVRLKKAGLIRIYIGIESGSETQLKRYNRGLSKNVIQNALNVLDELNIKYDGGFIMFDKELSIDEMLENIKFYKDINLIESNQWIWRPMVANLGSDIGNKLYSNGSGSKISYDTMEIKYEYDDTIVHHIQKIIDFKSAETRDFFYALKVISKEDYDYANETSFNTIAHNFVKKNGEIYVQFLEDMANLVKKLDHDIMDLVDICEQECKKNVFSVEDTKILQKYLMQLKNQKK